MKKLMITLGLALSLAATSVAFTACGDTSTKKEGSSSTEKAAAKDGGATGG